MKPTITEDGRLRVLQFRRDRPEFLCASADLQDHLRRHAYDCLHHHALWLRTLHYACQAGRATGARLVISPRGMLSDWSWRHRRWKKWLAARLVHPGAFAQAQRLACHEHGRGRRHPPPRFCAAGLRGPQRGRGSCPPRN